MHSGAVRALSAGFLLSYICRREFRYPGVSHEIKRRSACHPDRRLESGGGGFDGRRPVVL